MPFPTTSNAMAGEMDITINYTGGSSVTINSGFLGNWTPKLSPLTRSSSRLSGNSTTPTNQLDNPEITVPIYLNEWSDMQYIMPENMDGQAFVLGSGGSCTVPESAEVVFHYVCDGNDKSRDITLPVARIGFEDTNERNATDELAVNLHFYPLANPAGQVVYGDQASS